MAIYHLSVKNISRADGRSAVAAAAYRAGVRLQNAAEDRVSDFSNRSGVVHSEILLPEPAPSWMADRETLWNRVEAAEARKDARLAKEVEIALPIELARDANVALARSFAIELFARRGIVADLSVHDGGDGNPHAHILLATRSLAPDGFGPKDRRLDNRAFLADVREKWEARANEALEQHGAAARIDHRTLEAQGIDREPEEHRGPKQRDEPERPAAAPAERPKPPKKAEDEEPAEAAGAVEGEAEQASGGDGGGSGSAGLVNQLDEVEYRLAVYLASTAGERQRARQREQDLQDLNAYQLRIQRQQAYLENLKRHEDRAKQEHVRAVDKLFASFATTYRQPDSSFSSIWAAFLKSGPSLFSRKRPSLFGSLRGWSFLFFDSPKRKQAKKAAATLPDMFTGWIKAEHKVGEIEMTVKQTEWQISQAASRAMHWRETIERSPVPQLDPNRDRDIRIQLFQARSRILETLDPQDIASSELPEERKAALLSVAARYNELRDQGRSGR